MPESLDPADWHQLRSQGHRMLDDMFDFLEHVRDRRVWQPIPAESREPFRTPLPAEPTNIAEVHETLMQHVLPHTLGNVHPRFMGWVHGGGTAEGMLAEMVAAGLNANLGGRDHMPIEVERQVVEWVRELFEFPSTASGLFVTGTSQANLLAILVASRKTLGLKARTNGVGTDSKLVAYTSAGAHGCIAKALDVTGLGTDALRRIEMNHEHAMDVESLERSIAADRAAGLKPFLIVATVGSVDVGSIDDLSQIASIARRERMWMHVDGAFAALGMLSPHIAPRLAGLELADSVAFDFHKWGQVPYDAGFLLVRDGTLHHDTFASPAAYLQREANGMAAGSPWPCDFGIDLSRGFRALKVWVTIKTFGAKRLGMMIDRTCQIAQHLRERIESSPELELLAPVPLNIVCFRYRDPNPNELNAKLVVDLQQSGIAAPSTTLINGQVAIRAAIVNHRTESRDVDNLIDATLKFGRARKHRRGVPCAA